MKLNFIIKIKNNGSIKARGTDNHYLRKQVFHLLVKKNFLPKNGMKQISFIISPVLTLFWIDLDKVFRESYPRTISPDVTTLRTLLCGSSKDKLLNQFIYPCGNYKIS